jgi:hypothetical protein
MSIPNVVQFDSLRIAVAMTMLLCLISVFITPVLAFCPTLFQPKTTTVSSSTSFLSAALPLRKNALFTQVVSDVDDTLKSSGGVNVAGVALGGIDVQYERGDLYPGVVQFMLELSQYQGEGRELTRTPPKVAILTARAQEFKLALELNKPTSKLARAFVETGQAASVPNWGLGPVLYGSVAEWVLQTKKGLRKFNNFERLLQQDLTGTILQYIYVGDTGELDQEAGETMLREYPEVVKAVFLHVVTQDPSPPVIIPPPKLINGRPILFFRTYVGAAAMATQLGFMRGDGLLRVVEAAKDKLRNEPRESDKWTDLNRDIREAYRTVGLDQVAKLAE